MKKFFSNKRVKEVLTMIASGAILSLVFSINVLAADINSSKLVTGTTKLIKDGTKALTGIIGILTILISLFYGFKWYIADAETKPREAKSIKTTVVVGIVLTCISGVITAVLAYYK